MITMLPLIKPVGIFGRNTEPQYNLGLAQQLTRMASI